MLCHLRATDVAIHLLEQHALGVTLSNFGWRGTHWSTSPTMISRLLVEIITPTNHWISQDFWPWFITITVTIMKYHYRIRESNCWSMRKLEIRQPDLSQWWSILLGLLSHHQPWSCSCAGLLKLRRRCSGIQVSVDPMQGMKVTNYPFRSQKILFCS